MAKVEFLAFAGYVRKVLRNDETDGEIAGTAPAAQLRCRLWSKMPPSIALHQRIRTYVLDLDANPRDTPNFTAAEGLKLQCEAPGITRIGRGTTGLNGPFDLSTDYVNLVYLTTTFLGTIPNTPPAMDARPEWPSVSPTTLSGRTGITKGPIEDELKIIVYSNDHPVVERRNQRYVGRYVEVGKQVSGGVWNVKVFGYGSGSSTPLQLDFNDRGLCGDGTITPAEKAAGALYLNYKTTLVTIDLPKLPASEGDSTLKGLPAPSVEEIAELIKKRGPR